MAENNKGMLGNGKTVINNLCEVCFAMDLYIVCGVVTKVKVTTSHIDGLFEENVTILS